MRAFCAVSLALVLLPLAAAGATTTSLGGAPAPAVDAKRIINESFNFLPDREPDMTEAEYALYERVVPMIAVQPDFALRLLEGMLSDEEAESPAFEFVLANAYYLADRPAVAETHFRRAVERYPEFLRAWSNLGTLYYSLERYAEAVPCLIKAIELGDRDPQTLGVLGYCLWRGGNPLAAEFAYIQAYTAQPDNPGWVSALLDLSLETRQYARAALLAQQLVRLQPKEARHWLTYASVLVAQDRRVEALAVLDAAVGLGAADGETLLLLGDLMVEQKLFTEAVATYRKVIPRSPEAGTGRLLAYARALIAENEVARAGEILRVIDPDRAPEVRVEFLQTTAELEAARGHWAEARTALEAAARLEPLNGAVLLRLGQVLREANEPARATFVFDEAARVPEVAYRASLELASLALQARDYRAAAEALERALGLERSAELQDHLVRVRSLIPREE